MEITLISNCRHCWPNDCSCFYRWELDRCLCNLWPSPGRARISFVHQMRWILARDLDLWHPPTELVLMVSVACKCRICLKEYRSLIAATSCCLQEKNADRTRRLLESDQPKEPQEEVYVPRGRDPQRIFEGCGDWCRHGCCDLSEPHRRCWCRCWTALNLLKTDDKAPPVRSESAKIAQKHAQPWVMSLDPQLR